MPTKHASPPGQTINACSLVPICKKNLHRSYSFFFFFDMRIEYRPCRDYHLFQSFCCFSQSEGVLVE